VVFAVAGLTDLFDGLVARRGHQQTELGAFLDPIADKILLTGSFLALTWASGLLVRIPAWLTVTTVSRDAIIVVSVAVINLTHEKRVFPPSLLGKLSTFTQIVTAGVVLVLNALSDEFPPVVHLFRLTLAFTVASALHYTYQASVGRPPAKQGP
jgi:cardiolipin synthase